MNSRSAAAPRRFRRYPAYKDSGVEWLGEIPAHWEVERIRHVVHRIEQGWSPECENREADEDEWGVLKAGCVNRGLFIESEHKALPSDLEPIPALEIATGDLLMSRASGSRELVGSVAVVSGCRPRLLLCDKLFRLHVDAGRAHRRFFALAMNSRLARWQIEGALSGGSGLANNIAQQVVKDLIVVLPDLDEQEAIGAFLDRETVRIDALVEKKERLIELLQERRAALITWAVTKGLDPSVAMKDSGVEWLGEIPAHWDLVRVGRFATIGNGSTPKRENQEYWSSGEHPWLTSGKVNDEIISEADEFVTDAAIRECHLPRVSAGSVLVAITGEGQTRGRVALLQVPSTISQHLAFITPRDGRLVSAYLWRVLQSQYEWLRSESGGAGSTRAALTCEYLKSIKVPLPPRAEQREIAEMIGTSDGRFASLVHRVSEAIDSLKEFRTGLISAAVTGKIDVRNEAAA